MRVSVKELKCSIAKRLVYRNEQSKAVIRIQHLIPSDSSQLKTKFGLSICPIGIDCYITDGYCGGQE